VYTALLDKTNPAPMVGKLETVLNSSEVLSRLSLEVRPSLDNFLTLSYFNRGALPILILIMSPSQNRTVRWIQTVNMRAKEVNHTCIMQVEPAKQSIDLAQIQVLMVTGETGFMRRTVIAPCSI
jgi:hypothetical protein